MDIDFGLLWIMSDYAWFATRVAPPNVYIVYIYTVYKCTLLTYIYTVYICTLLTYESDVLFCLIHCVYI